MVRFIENMEQWNELIELSNTKLVVVDFTASWCGPCQMIAPKFDELSKTHTDVEFVKVDVDEPHGIDSLCGVQAMPTFQFYKGGKKVDEMKGANLNGLIALIGKHK